MNTWLYHINPKNRLGYTYRWDVEHPRTLLRSTDKEWPAGQMFRKVAVGDRICVFMKNIGRNPDGVYVVGSVMSVEPEDGTFVWQVDENRSARTIANPIHRSVIERFFGRGYGSSMQQLPPEKQARWWKLFGKGEVVEGAPLVKARGKPRASLPTIEPFVSREHGLRGELHVVRLLEQRYPKAKGFKVLHVSKDAPGSDHDIVVRNGQRLIRLVEVKTRMGVPGDPVCISERELLCRRTHHALHSIFVVYLGTGGFVRSVVEIDSRDSFSLRPRDHWLTPGVL